MVIFIAGPSDLLWAWPSVGGWQARRREEKPGKAAYRVTGNCRLRTKGRSEKATGNAKQVADEVEDAFKR